MLDRYVDEAVRKILEMGKRARRKINPDCHEIKDILNPRGLRGLEICGPRGSFSSRTPDVAFRPKATGRPLTMKDLTEGSVIRHLLHMASFMIVSMLAQTLYLLFDLYWVGGLGKEAIAAVGVAGNLMMIVARRPRCSASARPL